MQEFRSSFLLAYSNYYVIKPFFIPKKKKTSLVRNLHVSISKKKLKIY